MLRSFRRHLSFANVVSMIALFAALGGTSYAVATASIDSREIKNNTVRSKDIRNSTVRSKDVGNRSLLAEDFRPGELPAGPQGEAGPPGPAGDDAPELVVYGRASATDPSVELFSWPAMGIVVSTDGEADNSADILMENTRTDGGDLKFTKLDPDPSTGTGGTISPGDPPSQQMGGSILEVMITSNTSAHALLVTCKSNSHGGGDGMIHCFGVKSGP